MKIIVSSRYLYMVLARIEREKGLIDSIYPTVDGIVLVTPSRNYAINGDVHMPVPYINQTDVRFDLLKLHLSKVPEQPIVVEFSHNELKITYTF